MAKVIVFYIPDKFKPVVKYLPAMTKGKVIKFKKAS